jgi:hypothetical protein
VCDPVCVGARVCARVCVCVSSVGVGVHLLIITGAGPRHIYLIIEACVVPIPLLVRHPHTTLASLWFACSWCFKVQLSV